MFQQRGPALLLTLLIPIVLWAVGVAITAYIAYRVVRAGVRDGIRAARAERGPGHDQFE
ncbi:hypothetical protein [Kineococcus arenarius]|uniref:hypothetical protein n=1 Tax=unclassified Kineococcus TaxID=2621656 RepID=UPI003D7D7469